MTTVTIDIMQRNMREYLRRAQLGETITVIHKGTPVAEINPPSSEETLRPSGLCAGEFTVPDDFDDSLPEGILNEFEGR
jgi:antitoxin (DNA-binding transcriptional repressor) of toxin-antitoxin stability system